MAAVDIIFQIMDTIWVMIKWGWPFMLLIWLFIMKKVWSKYPIEAVIIEKRGSNLIKTNDRVGKLVYPTGEVGYKMHKSKDSIPIYNFDWVLHNVFVPNTIFERLVSLLRGNIGTIFLFRYGSKQYKPINIKEKGNNKLVYQPVKNDKGEDVVITVYQQFDPRDKMGALDFEVIDWDNMNFMVQEQRSVIERTRTNKEFWKQVLIPLAIIGACIVMGIFILYFSNSTGEALRSAAATKPAQTEQHATQPDLPIVGELIPGS